MHELLVPTEMAKADRLTVEGGRSGLELMEKAGLAVANAAGRLTTYERRVILLAGPGNNGGDAFVAARHLKQRGFVAEVFLLGRADKLKGDALEAYQSLRLDVTPIADQMPPLSELGPYDLIVDGLFGAGLDRPLEGVSLELVAAINASAARILAIDLPSGLDGRTGQVMGDAVKADATITFFRGKPGHYLFPGRGLCGALNISQIGIQETVFPEVAIDAFVNTPELWAAALPEPQVDGHKYNRGHLVVYSGDEFHTGAARLAALAGQRVGAGLTTVLAPTPAARIHAMHLSSVMVRPSDNPKQFEDHLGDIRLNAVVIGPAAGVGEVTRKAVHFSITRDRHVVLDADALTAFAGDSEGLAGLIKGAHGQQVLTPHEGEFARLFPDISADRSLSKIEKARVAAEQSGAIVVLKGADTVVAAPDGRAAVNTNGTPWLATGGSGDVLAGIIGGLLAQGVSGFEAAAMGVWLHGRAAELCGPMLVPEELISKLPAAYASAQV
ncbi:NAD(P)H-hydrate dehydratase [Pseudovibrio sp. SPO723]|uniref:NAD(P)H-hydrate dehydratase n=1 Tax=Nesiotobacter zosterae TaxID=392721 RepID=UPI0029C18273|nr:NAD(P)H-hydrate dehydratase [Pseudovibrio sp. SPO723]MDX5592695.1 NAD(P)H-hydrate dehydratase [Pseudovibrio sp. SPO723]